jgi:hypothetical protein
MPFQDNPGVCSSIDLQNIRRKLYGFHLAMICWIFFAVWISFECQSSVYMLKAIPLSRESNSLLHGSEVNWDFVYFIHLNFIPECVEELVWKSDIQRALKFISACVSRLRYLECDINLLDSPEFPRLKLNQFVSFYIELLMYCLFSEKHKGQGQLRPCSFFAFATRRETCRFVRLNSLWWRFVLTESSPVSTLNYELLTSVNF